MTPAAARRTGQLPAATAWHSLPARRTERRRKKMRTLRRGGIPDAAVKPRPKGPASKQIYGMLAEFDDPDRLIEAAHKARAEGYRKLDAFTPFPVHGLDEAIGFEGTKLPLLVFFGGL